MITMTARFPSFSRTEISDRLAAYDNNGNRPDSPNTRHQARLRNGLWCFAVTSRDLLAVCDCEEIKNEFDWRIAINPRIHRYRILSFADSFSLLASDPFGECLQALSKWISG
jgi:hypothetical protein